MWLRLQSTVIERRGRAYFLTLFWCNAAIINSHHGDNEDPLPHVEFGEIEVNKLKSNYGNNVSGYCVTLFYSHLSWWSFFFFLEPSSHQTWLRKVKENEFSIVKNWEVDSQNNKLKESKMLGRPLLYSSEPFDVANKFFFFDKENT